MMNKPIFLRAALVAGLAATGVVGAHAEDGKARGDNTQSEAAERTAIEGAKITLADAVAAAEKEAGGKASSVEFEHETASAGYEIEVFGAAGEQKIFVDAQSGQARKIARTDDEDDKKGEQDDD